MSAPRTLVAEPLTREAFAPFGDVIECSDAVRHFPINAGNTERYHDLARVDAGGRGRAAISIFRGQPRELPFMANMMERHRLGSQAFVALSGRPYLVLVAPPSPRPRADQLRLFLARAEQGVNYARDVWHHPLLALEAESDFLIVDRIAAEPDCEEHVLDEGVELLLP